MICSIHTIKKRSEKPGINSEYFIFQRANYNPKESVGVKSILINFDTWYNNLGKEAIKKSFFHISPPGPLKNGNEEKYHKQTIRYKGGFFMEGMDVYLKPTFAINSDNEKIIKKAKSITSGCSNDRERAVKLFYFVRDSIPYNFYMISVFPEDFVASKILEWGKGYCVQKAVLLAALGRASGIPSRPAFAMIRNNRAPERIVKILGGNVFPRHGYNQFFLEGKWVSAASNFDVELCKRFELPPVEFDGKEDALLPGEDCKGNLYVEYLKKFSPEADLPFEWIVAKTSKIVGKDKRAWLSREEGKSLGLN